MDDSTQDIQESVPPDHDNTTQPRRASADAPFLDPEGEFLVKMIALQDGLIAWATGDPFDDVTYSRYRGELLSRHDLRHLVPSFVKKYRGFAQFWGWIKVQEGTYAARRRLIWDAFHPLIDHLERGNRIPSDDPISASLASLDAEAVEHVWRKALGRRVHDPEGAITLAKSLLETVCKHILDALDVEYDARADLPKLWSLASEQLKLSPRQHREEVFRKILGNCHAIVGNLAAVRNKLGDAHGHGRRPVKPQTRHAELAVNLAGTMASFLVTTWENWGRQQNDSA